MYVCMFVCMYVGSSNGQILPITTEHVYPSMSTAGAPVYTPRYTSAYSYFGVEFDVGHTYESQDLYTYAWTGGNYFKPGIAWIRRDPSTDAILDEGFIQLPNYRNSLEVGIVQDDYKNVFVVLAYIDNNFPLNGAAMVEIFSWTNIGINPIPVHTENIRFIGAGITASQSWADRITMDCIGLKKVVFSWNERSFLISPTPPATTPIVISTGGIFLRAAEIGYSGTSPLTFSLQTERIDGTDSLCVGPDVALGNNGSTVYVAYMKRGSTAISGDVLVEQASFTDVWTATGSVPFINEYTEADASKIYDNSDLNNHIRIDAPDSLYANLWTMTYLKDFDQLCAVTMDPFTFTPNLMTGLLSGTLHSFCSPAIAYASSADHISLAWYDQQHKRYFGTRLNIQGDDYESPASVSTYYIINMGQNLSEHCFNGGKIAYSTSQQQNGKNLFMAYTTSEDPITPWLSNMITKMSPLSAVSPFSKSMNMDKINLSFAPNPVNEKSALISNDNQLTIEFLHITDALGKIILSIQNMSMTEANKKIRNSLDALPSGWYTLSTKVKNEDYNFKIIKK